MAKKVETSIVGRIGFRVHASSFKGFRGLGLQERDSLIRALHASSEPPSHIERETLTEQNLKRQSNTVHTKNPASSEYTKVLYLLRYKVLPVRQDL